MKRRKPILSLIFLLILCVVLQSAAFADGSLLSNADFSLPELPDGWDTVAYEAENYSVYTQNGALVIASAAENDVRVCHMIQVEPNTVYRLSSELSAEGVHGGHAEIAEPVGVGRRRLKGFLYLHSKHLSGL